MPKMRAYTAEPQPVTAAADADAADADHPQAAAAGAEAAATAAKPKAPRKKKVIVEVTERDPTPRRPTPGFPGPRYFKALSWNVNGLRGTLRNAPEALSALAARERPDLLCLQETKLQEMHVADFAALLPGYDAHWSCSTKKKGYSGTVVFTAKPPAETARAAAENGSRKQAKLTAFFGKSASDAVAAAAKDDVAPEAGPIVTGGSAPKVVGVRHGIGADADHGGEGRAITIEYEKFFVVCLYVPNSGQSLERLEYRTTSWDPALRAFVAALEAEGKPVIVTGDLNVAHLDLDIYNAGAPHLKKQAGCTPAERASFDAWVNPAAAEAAPGAPHVRDAFRHLYPAARGCYTYWSARKAGRDTNKGLRLDYFLCTPSLLPKEGQPSAEAAPAELPDSSESSSDTVPIVHDVFHDDITTVGLSDHCPVGLILRLPVVS
ncbi:Endonuclease/exonuclease/phosphatase [Tribonema minus]|uniref:DNA-(apurinic or apyrimidinic site) endonuclease n=1 Tax=Tribonema minus TaxID=303371 RepID=A0A835YNZ2_9STRA|nr:Endonuclease/exonuclease/phosphatase [Tribonema minus]